jgi:N-acetylneuraminate synthase
MSSIAIGNRLVGENYPPIVIAEIGINHEGSINKAI